LMESATWLFRLGRQPAPRESVRDIASGSAQAA
jgi:hypothetical protein